MEFDYIIVGDGSLGYVLTSWLSASPTNKVLLPEAGDSLFLAIPICLR
ncbi:hypothetical protein OQJ02_01900 [Legionella sp. PATHC032]|nr:hypothetical protein [Legionella sp. PATHC032]MCW8420384.1 hypothetical protein [Legionella sp. PATHC032]HAZ7572089.1 hypothetical protein [Legionella pneumophila]HBA1635231.1 hypothetical protein [Legionella pneumophila]